MRGLSLAQVLSAATAVALAASASAADPQDVAFEASHDGSTQRYVVIEPEGPAARRPAGVLVALHGHGSDRWQFVRAERAECKAAREAAARHGMIFVSPDYRATTSWMGPAAEADMVQILEETKKRYRVSTVIVSGGSMGGTAALIFAARHPELADGVVAMNGTADMTQFEGFADAVAASYGGTKEERPDEYQARSAVLHADRLTMPVALTTGGRDTVVPPASVLRLAELLKARNRPVLAIHRPEGGHETNHADATAAFEFVIGRLKGVDPDESATGAPE